jgi:Icc-related predicted phosphoesterase
MAADRLLFFATDVHGSESCFRKWLNAADVYEADLLVMGGDITGKLIVPLHPADGGLRARFRDESVTVASDDELAAFERRVADAGGYLWRCEPDEAEATLGDDEAAERLFGRLAADRVRRWVELADQRLGAKGRTAFIIAGNDDPGEVDDALASGQRLVNADHRVVWLEDWLPMLSIGESTPTPWTSPREIGEEEYQRLVDGLVADLPEPARAVFNLHVPPYDSQLDIAPELDEDLRVRYSAVGDVRQRPVGSRAVRAAIERYQPLLGLHGHVHEGRGRARIGSTVCFNPGSDYGHGVLCGVLIQVSEKRGVRDYTFTSG